MWRSFEMDKELPKMVFYDMLTASLQGKKNHMRLGCVARMTLFPLRDGVLPAINPQLWQPGWEAALTSLSRMEHDSHDLDNGSCSAGMGACENACLWKRSFVSWQEVSGGKTWRKPIETSSTANGTRRFRHHLWITFVFCPFLSKVLLRHLLSSSLLPTLITLNTAVLTCAQVARWHGALEITSALKLVYNEQLVSVQTWSFQAWQNLNGNSILESKEKCSSGCWQKYLQCSSLIFQLLWTMATCGHLDKRHDRILLLARWYKLWCCFLRL